jgi:hypothetical protein
VNAEVSAVPGTQNGVHFVPENEPHLFWTRLVSVAKCVDSSKHGSVIPINWA